MKKRGLFATISTLLISILFALYFLFTVFRQDVSLLGYEGSTKILLSALFLFPFMVLNFTAALFTYQQRAIGRKLVIVSSILGLLPLQSALLGMFITFILFDYASITDMRFIYALPTLFFMGISAILLMQNFSFQGEKR